MTLAGLENSSRLRNQTSFLIKKPQNQPRPSLRLPSTVMCCHRYISCLIDSGDEYAMSLIGSFPFVIFHRVRLSAGDEGGMSMTGHIF
jgi:hypothetical protein